MIQARYLLNLLLLTLLFGACKNDLKLNAPYKEIPSIYAILNPQENVQIVRVNKVFLGESDASAMAQVADSINYPAGELTVTLDRYEPGSKYQKQIDAAPIAKKRSIVFHDSVIQAVPGAFNTTQRVYVAYDDLHEGPALRANAAGGTEPNPNWKVSGDYILTVKNNRTGNVFTAKSTIVDSVKPSGTRPFKTPYYPYAPGTDPIEYVDYTAPGATFNVRVIPNEAQIYQVVIRLHFYDLSGGAISRYYYVDYPGTNLDVSRDKRVAANGSTYMQYDFLGSDIFYNVGNQLGKMGLSDNVTGRKMFMVEYFIYNSTQDYQDYIEFVKPSLSISQGKPLYSNFENRDALGLFTFRSRCSIRKEMSNTFINAFSDNSSTCRYLFLTVDNNYRGCK